MASSESVHEEEQQEGQIIENLEEMEHEFGEVIEEHESILKEEKDAVKKLEAAEKLVEHSRNLEEKYLNARNSGEGEKVDEWLLKEMAVVVAIFQAVQSEIKDLEQKMQTEASQTEELSQFDNKLYDRERSVLSHHLEAENGRNELPFPVDDYTQEFQSSSASELMTTVNKLIEHDVKDIDVV